MNNPWLPEKHRILDIIEETDLESTFVVEFPNTSIRHGQFFEISLPKIGEAPISVSSFTDSTVEFTIRRVGKLTNVIFDLAPGDDLYIRGPYGNGFPLETFKNKHVVVIAGGTGVAPVRSTLKHFLHHPQDCKDVYAIAGFRDPSHTLFENDLKAFVNAPHFHTTLTLDNGQKEGFKEGFAMNYEEHIYVSFERKMSCALGKCGHCKINETYVCLEGPVFPYTKAKTLMD